LAVCVASAAVSVPAVVTGEPETLNNAGRLKPTLVTVPPPLPEVVALKTPADRVRLLPIVISSAAPELAVVRPRMRAVFIVRPAAV
jgi:hypothetical protein